MSPIQLKRAHHHSLRNVQRIALVFCVLTLLLAAFPTLPASAKTALPVTAEVPKTIPLNQLGATADQQLADQQLTGQQAGIRSTATGAAVQAILQDLAGDVTPQGLWLHSTAEDESDSQPFRIKATALGRGETVVRSFAENGTVQVSGDLGRWLRPGVVEEYSTSTDGVRQDFLLSERPAGNEPLRLELAVTGAQVMLTQGTGNSVTLRLAGSGRQLVYHQLQVTDADGRPVPAQMNASNAGGITLLVEDQSARWPLRIDPTFSDADWQAFGSSANGIVWTLTVMGSDLYIGGQFTRVGALDFTGIAKWNGNIWSGVGGFGVEGPNAVVLAMVASGSELYVGGNFIKVGGVTARNVARWNGSSWSTLGSGADNGVNDIVTALALIGSDLYVGGAFTTAGQTSTNHVAKWNVNGWSALGAGVDNSVIALAVSGSNLYVGGTFTTVDGASISGIARWNGSGWSALGSGMNGSVAALAVSGSTLYAGGFFSTAGGGNANNIARWDGSSWSALDAGVNSKVNALAVSGGDLYVGGHFTSAGGISANHIAKWNVNGWSALGPGVNDTVWALAFTGSDLYVGGAFTTAGGVSANHLTRWNGSGWSTLVNSVENTLNPPVTFVTALAVSSSDLYVGGNFTAAGNVSANRIAKWDGNRWSALGSGLSDTVWALAVVGSDLYAGGSFGVLKWNGSTWSTPGNGVFFTVLAMAVGGSDLYVGGLTGLAKWNGSSWLFIDLTFFQLPLVITALATSGSDLYIGGDFSRAVNGTPVNHIAKWSGSTWSALGSSVNGFVKALAVSGGDLYIGGSFTTAGGVSANNIAKWDGSSWSALGSGLNNQVNALAVSGSNLYVGGPFTAAGNKDTYYIAQANLPPTDVTAPVITPQIDGSLGANGWYVDEVYLSWSVVDAESAVTSQSGCDPVSVTNDTTGITFTCTATSAGGNSSKSVTIKRDATPPTVTVTGVSDGATYTLGSAPTAGCNTSDATSGVATAATVTVTGGNGDGTGNFTATCRGATDNAANPSSATVHYTVNAITCLAGAYYNGATCVPAPAGSYVPTAGATAATPCAPGSYQDLTGQSSCKPAPAGSFVSSTGATASVLCTPGAYQDQPGQSQCKPAPVDNFVAVMGATIPLVCPADTYQDQEGQIACLPLPTLNALSPATIPAGSAAFVLTVNGASFPNGAQVLWNGAALATTVVSAAQLTADVPLANIAASGAATITVIKPPSNRQSAPLPFTVTAPQGANLTIVLDAQPESKTNFTFKGTLGLFRLDDSLPDDGDGYTQRKTFVVEPGNYTITQQPLVAWPLMAITCDPTSSGVVDLVNGKVTLTMTTGVNVTCTFTNQRAGKLTVGKYNDLNHNHVRNANDAWLSGWTMQLFTAPNAQVGSQTTASNGSTSFLNVRPGSYTVCETMQTNWFNITPSALHPLYQQPCYSVTIAPGQAVAVRFGNSTTPLTVAAEADDFTDIIVMELPDTDDDGNEVSPLPDPWLDAPAEEANTLFLPLVMQ